MSFKKFSFITCMIMMAWANTALPDVTAARMSEWSNEYQRIMQQIQDNRQGSAETGIPPSQIFEKQALIWNSDRSPVDVAIRRVGALLRSLKARRGVRGISDLESRFRALKNRWQGRTLAKSSAAAEREMEIYNALSDIRRQAQLSNPLLQSFDDILFVERSAWTDLESYRHEPKGGHMCDQYHGHNGRPGGGMYILKNYKSANPQLVDVVAGLRVPSGTHEGKLMSEGAFISPDLSWDGRTIVFGWSAALGFEPHWVTENRFHIFKVNIDGTGLARLTDGNYDDFDPCWLPNGRLVFISTRRGGYLRCGGGGRTNPTYALYGMKADGSDIIRISFHETHEWHPSVNNDGMITYTRWDYVDREDCIAHHIWLCYPDGRDPRAPHGNYPVPLETLTGTDWPDGRTKRPFAEFNIRAIPNSPKYIATAGPHHGQSFGSIVMIDTRIEDDNQMSQVQRITPDAKFPESEAKSNGGPYATPWPLSEGLYLVNYNDGIYLLDSLGNRELIYRTAAVKFRPLDPMPVAPRWKPPVIPTQTHQGENLTADDPNATISVMNVYETDEFGALPQGTVIKEMRLVQIIPKYNPYKDRPRTSHYDESLTRIPLGTVPVESDGSVYCEAPVKKAIYFQLLDANGMAVQSMRSDTYVHPGEHLSCTGCHESKWESIPITPNPLAMQRPPSKITPEAGGVEPVNFYRLVKPVFDAKCADCHRQQGGPDMSYGSLSKDLLFGFPGSQRDNYRVARFGGSRTVPGRFGAYESELYKGGYLDASHHDVSLTAEEKRRITLWLDLNSNELGAYEDVAEQKRGDLVWPMLDVDPENPLGVEKRPRVPVRRPVDGPVPGTGGGQTFTLSIPGSGSLVLGGVIEPGEVHIADLFGRTIRTLRPHSPRLRWDGNHSDGSAVPVGIYLAQVAGKHKTHQKIFFMNR